MREEITLIILLIAVLIGGIMLGKAIGEESSCENIISNANAIVLECNAKIRECNNIPQEFNLSKFVNVTWKKT